MAKAKRKAPESTSATLANGTKISGPPAAVARLVAHSKVEVEQPKETPSRRSTKSDNE